MMALQFLGPVLASVLYVIVFQKAGFNGAVLAFCATPILGVLLSHTLYRMMATSADGMMILIPLIVIPLSLAPLLILAFKSWPPVAAPNIRSEK